MLPALHRALVAALLLSLLLASCRAGAEQPESPTVTVGVGSTTEQRVLAALTAVALEYAGLTPELRLDVGDTVALRRQARLGLIDLYWDYTGAAWVLGLGQQEPPPQPLESYQRVREEDLINGLVWLEPTAANATLALFVREDDLPLEEPTGMGWLATTLSQDEESLCVDDDFRQRPGGLPQLATEYYPMNLERVEIVSADATEAVALVAQGRCFSGLATATSGEAREAGLVAVEDELGVFPAFVVAPVARQASLDRVSQLPEAVEPVTALLDTATLAALNGRVHAGEDPEEVAREVLAHLEPPPADE